MSTYVFGSGISYKEWQRQKHLTRLISREIDASSRSLIASNEQLHRRRIEVQEQAIRLQREEIDLQRETAQRQADGMEQLTYRMDDVVGKLATLNATFEWGFSGVMAKLGGLNDSLNDLIRIAKTPAQTWAYEQFDIAREAFSKGLYEDALTYIQYAITGFGSYTGYRLEHRFHQLLGIIRLGSYDNIDESIVNLAEAENAFREAAKYAEKVLPEDAAMAMLSAGWSAYCQGEMERARSHTQKALEYRKGFSEADFQLAKIEMHEGRVDEGLPPLRRAIMREPEYVIKAASDMDINKHNEAMRSLLDDLRMEAQQKATVDFAATRQAITDAKVTIRRDFPHAKSSCMNTAIESFDKAKVELDSSTYFGFLEASEKCQVVGLQIAAALKTAELDNAKEIRSLAVNALSKAKELEANMLQKQKSEELDKQQTARNRGSLATMAVWLFFGGVLTYGVTTIVSICLGVVLLKEYRASPDKTGMGKAIVVTVLGGGLVFAILYGVVFSNIYISSLAKTATVVISVAVVAAICFWVVSSSDRPSVGTEQKVLDARKEREACEQRANTAESKLHELDRARDREDKARALDQFIASIANYSPDRLRFEISKREKAITELKADVREEDHQHAEFLSNYPDHMHKRAYEAHYEILAPLEEKMRAARAEIDILEAMLPT